MSIRNALALVLACASWAHAAPDGVPVESRALGFELRFPVKPEVSHSDASDEIGRGRSHHWVADEKKRKTEQSWQVLVVEYTKLALAPEETLRRLLARATDGGEEVLSQSTQARDDRVQLRAHWREPASDGAPAQETRALYAISHGLVYVLKHVHVAGDREGATRWERFAADLVLRAPSISRDWVPHLSGQGAFSALFPTRPGAEREETTEVGGRSVAQVVVAAAEAGRWELEAAAHPLAGLERDQALAAARRRALEGLTDPQVQRDVELRPGSWELVLSGAANGGPAARLVRITVGDEVLLMARATGFGAQSQRAILEEFVATARPVPRFDGSALQLATPDGASVGARLGTGESLHGSAGSWAKTGRFTYDIHSQDMTMLRAEFRVSDAEYLGWPALSAYSSHWKLHRTREVALEGGAGFARSYFTRDGDDVIAIHERVTVDAERYRCRSVEIRNRAILPEHVERLFDPRE